MLGVNSDTMPAVFDSQDCFQNLDIESETQVCHAYSLTTISVHEQKPLGTMVMVRTSRG